MENRTRPIQIKFFVTEQERDVIRQRMELIGTTNLSAYMRKISQDGFLYFQIVVFMGCNFIYVVLYCK